MPNSNDACFDSREELLLELQDGRAQQLRQYAEDDDAVTRFLEEPLGEPEWIVVVGVHDRRMLSCSQLLTGLRTGELSQKMLAWRSGMRAWSAIAEIPALTRALAAPVSSQAPSPEAALRVAPPQRPPSAQAPAKIAEAKIVVPAFESELSDALSDAAPDQRVKRVVMGLSALIMFGVFLSMFAISSARDASSGDSAEPAQSSSAAPATRAPLSTPDEAPAITRRPDELPAASLRGTRAPGTRQRPTR